MQGQRSGCPDLKAGTTANIFFGRHVLRSHAYKQVKLMKSETQKYQQILTMFKPYLKSTAPCVRYFYLPANNTRDAEIIQVLNSGGHAVQVPMREEDVELTAFFERELTKSEKLTYKNSETWKVFTSWDEIEQDHINYGLAGDVLPVLLSLSYKFPLEEAIAISA